MRCPASRESTRGADIPPVRCLLSRTHETGSKSSWSSGLLSLWVLSLACVGRSCVRWSVVLVLGAVVWSSCRAWSSGPVSGLVPRDLFLPVFLKRGCDPGHRPKNRFFDRYSFYCRGTYLRFTWPWDLWILRFLIIFLFSVCSGRCRIISNVAASLEPSVAAASVSPRLIVITRFLFLRSLL